jgi:hypothetical protein
MADEGLLKWIATNPGIFDGTRIIRDCLAYAHAVIAHDSLDVVEG